MALALCLAVLSPFAFIVDLLFLLSFAVPSVATPRNAPDRRQSSSERPDSSGSCASSETESPFGVPLSTELGLRKPTSHPPTEHRIERLRAMEAMLGGSTD